MDIIFSQTLKLECFYSGITLKELSEKTGISYTTLLSYTKTDGALPRCDIALKIASALNVTIEYLLTGQPFPTKQKSKHYPVTSDIKKIDRKYLEPLSVLIHELADSENGGPEK